MYIYLFMYSFSQHSNNSQILPQKTRPVAQGAGCGARAIGSGPPAPPGPMPILGTGTQEVVDKG